MIRFSIATPNTLPQIIQLKPMYYKGLSNTMVLRLALVPSGVCSPLLQYMINETSQFPVYSCF